MLGSRLKEEIIVVIRFNSFTKAVVVFCTVFSCSILMIGTLARPAMAQSGAGFDAGAEKKLNFGVNQLKFDDVPVGETSAPQNVVITTSQKAITLNAITVKPPFVETGCSCVFVNPVTGASLVDCSAESLPLQIPADGDNLATTCVASIVFEPTSSGKVDLPHGFRADFDARNSSKHIRLIGIGTDD